jgi:WD40 repeat protein
MTVDVVFERVRAADPAPPRQGDYEELFRAIVATPADPRLARQRRRVTGTRLVLVALIVFLILAGTATAMYFALRDRDSLTFPSGDSIAAVVGSDAGQSDKVWQCPDDSGWCGEITGVAWSPDGERLALMFGALSADSRYLGFHLIDPRTGSDQHISAQKMVPTFGCFSPSYLTWSPDGKRLAYVCRGIGTAPDGSGGIYTIRPDGSERRLIATGPFQAFSPTWSPDSKRIAFVSNRTGDNDIWVMSAAGKDAHDLTGDDEDIGDVDPAWSPDGDTIMWASTRNSDTLHLWYMDTDGKNPREAVTITDQPDHDPDWSPDGNFIVFHRGGQGEFVLVATKDGKILQKVEMKDDWVRLPAWR